VARRFGSTERRRIGIVAAFVRSAGFGKTSACAVVLEWMTD
jgi:hypothetical protein